MAGFITMAVTPNYGWPVPVATDYVKDGYEAIADLGDAIDATVFGLGSGFNLISTTAFSGATSQSFGSDASPIFTSAYRNYRIILDNLAVATTGQNLKFRLRANTTDLTSAVYDIQSLYAISTTIGGGRTASATSCDIASLTTDARTCSFVFDITNPQTTKIKNIISSGIVYEPAEGVRMFFHNSNINSTVAHNGFTIFASNNISGNISIYGYDI
jgi:hypothetical protein